MLWIGIGVGILVVLAFFISRASQAHFGKNQPSDELTVRDTRRISETIGPDEKALAYSPRDTELILGVCLLIFGLIILLGALGVTGGRPLGAFWVILGILLLLGGLYVCLFSLMTYYVVTKDYLYIVGVRPWLASYRRQIPLELIIKVTLVQKKLYHLVTNHRIKLDTSLGEIKLYPTLYRGEALVKVINLMYQLKKQEKAR